MTAPTSQARMRALPPVPKKSRNVPIAAITIAGPPISAVGFLCQRSAFGFATRLASRARRRATGVRMTATRTLTVKVRRIRTGSDGDTVVFGHQVDDLRKARARLESHERADLADVGDPSRHVLEPGLVGLIVGDEDDLRLALEPLLDELGEAHDGNLLLRADVEDLAVGLLARNERGDRADDVAHVAETARLRAVAVHRDRL